MKQLLAIKTIILLAIIAIIALSSCSTSNLAHKPSRREIREAMSYSTSDYTMPRIKNNTGVCSKSNLCFHPEN